MNVIVLNANNSNNSMNGPSDPAGNSNQWLFCPVFNACCSSTLTLFLFLKQGGSGQQLAEMGSSVTPIAAAGQSRAAGAKCERMSGGK